MKEAEKTRMYVLLIPEKAILEGDFEGVNVLMAELLVCLVVDEMAIRSIEFEWSEADGALVVKVLGEQANYPDRPKRPDAPRPRRRFDL